MKRVLFSLLMILSFILASCGTGSVPTQHTIATSLPRATSTTLPPSPTSTSTVTPTASPTPIFTLDLSKYDPDLFPPGVVEHEQPPLIARSDETVLLAFWVFDTIYCEQLQRYCRVEPLLYYSYGEEPAFQGVPLVKESVNGLEQWVAHLPATDKTGGSLHYYAEFTFPEAGYTQRYPTAGIIDLFTTENFIPIELPAEHPVKPGDKVYKFYWGYGPNTVRNAVQGHFRVGPPALDVASDGRIALLNPIDNRVLIYDPREETYSSFPLPFTVSAPDSADLAFNQQDQLVVCDFDGKRVDEIPRSVPYCYRLLPDGTIGVAVPLYVNFPMQLTRDVKVLDRYDYKLVTPFDSGQPNSREDQRPKQTWKLPYRLVVSKDGSLDWRTARFADLETGLAFEVHAETGLAVLIGFEKTPEGYLMIFDSTYEQIRAVWIDPAGKVLKDVSLPNVQYSVVSWGGISVASDGSLYVMSSTKNGIEIHVAAAP